VPTTASHRRGFRSYRINFIALTDRDFRFRRALPRQSPRRHRPRQRKSRCHGRCNSPPSLPPACLLSLVSLRGPFAVRVVMTGPRRVRQHTELTNDTHHETTNRTTSRQRYRRTRSRTRWTPLRPETRGQALPPHSYGRWLLTEIDPVHTDRAYGLCDCGHGLPELGFVSLRDLENIHGPQRTTLGYLAIGRVAPSEPFSSLSITETRIQSHSNTACQPRTR